METTMSKRSMLNKVMKDASFRMRPAFSLFGYDAMGEGTLLMLKETKGVFGDLKPEIQQNAQAIVDKFHEEAMANKFVGLEIRCDGVRVALN